MGSVKVLSDSGSGSWSWSYYALDWLATNPTRPAVASMSLGGSSTQQAMADAVNAAVNAGVVVVVAGGNSNSDACNFSPAFVPSAITVGSTDSSDTGTATFSGTSMACPHVSGAAALVLGADNSKRPQKVISDLLDDAALDTISDLKAGDTNAMLFVGAGGAPPTPPTRAPPPTPAPTGPCYSFCSQPFCGYPTFCGGCPFC